MTRILLTIAFCVLSIQVASANPKTELGFLLNQERQIKGIKPLSENKKLSKAAQKHANDMRENDYFSHTSKNGTDFFKRIENQKYIPCYAAENIAQGQKLPKNVIKDWMDSRGHRANNLSPKASEYGIGLSGDYWVLIFARPC